MNAGHLPFEGTELILRHPLMLLAHFLLSLAIPNIKSSLHIKDSENSLSLSCARSIVPQFGRYLYILLLIPTPCPACSCAYSTRHDLPQQLKRELAMGGRRNHYHLKCLSLRLENPRTYHRAEDLRSIHAAYQRRSSTGPLDLVDWTGRAS